MGKGDEASGHCSWWWRDGHVFVMHMGQNPCWLRINSWLVNMDLFNWDTWLGGALGLGWKKWGIPLVWEECPDPGGLVCPLPGCPVAGGLGLPLTPGCPVPGGLVLPLTPGLAGPVGLV